MRARVLVSSLLASCAPSAEQAPSTEVPAITARTPISGQIHRLDADGVLLGAPSVEGQPEQGLRLRLRARGDRELARVRPVELACEAADIAVNCRQRVEYHHPGLTEWWISRPDGMEQGFDVAEPADDDGTLVLAMALDGARSARVEAGRALLLDEDGRPWRVDGLWARDADGTSLATRMEGDEAELRFWVDTRGAKYPLKVDPVYTTAATTLDGASDGDLFGYSVAGAGDVNGDGYPDLVVGAFGWSSYRGAVYVFTGDADGLDPARFIEIDHTEETASFGLSVSGAGDVNGDGYDDIIVGDAYGGADYGAANVYLGGPDGTETTASAELTGPSPSSSFGFSVGGGGDVNGDGYDDVVVGAASAEGIDGRVFVYYGGADGLDTESPAELSITSGGGALGSAVAMGGDTNGDGYDDVLASAPRLFGDTGEAYVFYGSADGVSAETSSNLQTTSAFSLFGTAIAGAGDVNGDGYDDVVVGTYLERSYLGGVHLFPGTADGPLPASTLDLAGSASGDRFGSSIASAGDVNGDGYDDVLVGAIGARTGTDRISTGAAYLFHGASIGLESVDPTVIEGAELGDTFGNSVAGIGDVNGDGLDDVAVGAPYTVESAGSVTIYLGYADDEDGDGVLATEDCDDEAPTVYPDAPELCDRIDNDCDGVVPDDELDADGDGLSACQDDCDDANPLAYPDAEEITGDGVDEDCDGKELCYIDADGDGARVEETVASEDADCDDPGEATADASLDCADTDATISPDLEEACDRVDNNCDTLVPANERDEDGDGIAECEGDCDDGDESVFPGAEDSTQDGIDQDCDETDGPVPTGGEGGEGGEDSGEDKEGGCACASGGSARGAAWLGVALALASRRRRTRG